MDLKSVTELWQHCYRIMANLFACVAFRLQLGFFNFFYYLMDFLFNDVKYPQGQISTRSNVHLHKMLTS